MSAAERVGLLVLQLTATERNSDGALEAVRQCLEAWASARFFDPERQRKEPLLRRVLLLALRAREARLLEVLAATAALRAEVERFAPGGAGGASA